ncbi:glycogen debranching protein [Enemella dayhoffiae]|uniref:Glycogen debranching protein n=1 Tax=Enemella dayhoffiae TaxID=2016507 RepID=A0A255HA57_9ACTN|nr:glycogen debranching protein [Enemella dayhoffiae]
MLRDNDLGHMIKAGPSLYPHQWSWDAAFVAIGLAQLSVPRAIAELRTVLAGQWRTGMLPHIIFSDEPGYFPDFDDWGTAVAPALPAGVHSSGICQPPVHAIALELVLQQARRCGGEDLQVAEEFAAEALRRLTRWHEWLSTARGYADVVEIHHGWESGMDNSPRWDEVYAGVKVSRRLEFARMDLNHADASERPSDEEYQRYITLIEQMKSVQFDDVRVKEVLDFRVTDVFMAAILVLAAESLTRIAEDLGQADVATTERARAERTRAGVLATIDPVTGLCRDFDINAQRWLSTESMGGFAAVLMGGDDAETQRQREILLGERWCGHPEMAFPLPPSVSLDSPQLRPREYWRGPVWPVMNWLFAWTALRSGHREDALAWRLAGLDQLRDLSFGEYYEPRTNETLGSPQQSWSAMAAIDWLTNPDWQS